MNFKIVRRPGGEVLRKINEIEEMWADLPSDPPTPMTVEMMRKDMFELLGIIKGMMTAIEVGALASATPENDE